MNQQKHPSEYNRPSVCLVTLGCPKNQVDSHAALADFLDRGWCLTDDPEKANVLVVNTCAFIQAAEEETIQAVLEAAQLKKKNRHVFLMVVGCWIAKHGEKTIRRLVPEIDAVGMPGDVAGWNSLIAALGPVQQRSVSRKQLKTKSALSFGPGTAYLKIAEGCSRRCAFCLIPRLRGPLRSRPMDEIVAEAKAWANRGVLELILVAQDTSAYGRDLRNGASLAKLLDRLVAIPKVKWIRIMYVNPDGIDEALISRMAREKKICPYIDMPVQHAHAGVLKAMKRSGDSARYLNLIARLRRRIPGVAIRTTLLSGFPGETAAAHDELMRFVQQARFNRLGVFSYSNQAGTAAAAIRPKVPKAVREKRRRELMAVQSTVSQALLQAAVGKTVACLVEESLGKNQWIGRTVYDAPEIDGGIILTGKARPGTIVKAKIIGSTEHDLTGVIA